MDQSWWGLWLIVAVELVDEDGFIFPQYLLSPVPKICKLYIFRRLMAVGRTSCTMEELCQVNLWTKFGDIIFDCCRVIGLQGCFHMPFALIISNEMITLLSLKMKKHELRKKDIL